MDSLDATALIVTNMSYQYHLVTLTDLSAQNGAVN